MALFGGARDISLFRNLNYELLGDIISQQIIYYKHNISKTKTNIYGETTGHRFFNEPVILFCRITRGDQTNPITDLGVGFEFPMTFSFLRDHMVEANVVPEVGDVIMYQENYFEADAVNENKFFAGKDPLYPYEPNPTNPGLDQFGYNVQFELKTHYVPADKLNIEKIRL
jgi:hypothetical protein